jgi:acylphosphatase
MSAERIEATVHGRVQGVGFRLFVLRRAQALGLAGWVANRPDGSVAVVAEGPAEALGQLLDLLHDGPPGAGVRSVEVDRGPARGESPGFDVRSGHHSGD